MRLARSMIPSSIAVLTMCSVASASLLMGVNDGSIIGNGGGAQDGFNITRDTSSGLDWLDLTLSSGLSYAEVSAEFGDGGKFEGFRHATTGDIEGLFLGTAGLSLGSFHGVNQSLIELQDFVGITQPFFNAWSAGYFDASDFEPWTPPGTLGWAALAHDPHEFTIYGVFIEKWDGHQGGSSGNWLVRDTPPVPEVGSLVVWLLVLIHLGQRRWRNR